MKDLLTKYCASEIRDIKKKNPKIKPKEINLKNKEIFSKSFFGKRISINNKDNERIIKTKENARD